jgi:hypothetical protein
VRKRANRKQKQQLQLLFFKLSLKVTSIIVSPAVPAAGVCALKGGGLLRVFFFRKGFCSERAGCSSKEGHGGEIILGRAEGDDGQPKGRQGMG